MNNTHLRTLTALLVALLALPAAAFAHAGSGPVAPAHGGFAAGLLHPLLGLDHLLAMLAVGVWAAQLGGRCVWVVPAAFVGLMAAGAYLGAERVALPFVEAGIAASVLILGLAIALARRASVYGAAAVVGVFALFHGHAHGTELAAGLSGATYGVGFSLTTLALHVAGIALTSAIRRWTAARAAQFAGGVIACAGLGLHFGL